MNAPSMPHRQGVQGSQILLLSSSVHGKRLHESVSSSRQQRRALSFIFNLSHLSGWFYRNLDLDREPAECKAHFELNVSFDQDLQIQFSDSMISRYIEVKYHFCIAGKQKCDTLSSTQSKIYSDLIYCKCVHFLFLIWTYWIKMSFMKPTKRKYKDLIKFNQFNQFNQAIWHHESQSWI